MKTYFFQIETGYIPQIIDHAVFGLPNVHLYIYIPCEYPSPPPGYPGITVMDMKSYAWNAVNWVEYAKKLVKQYHPQKDFKYGMCSAGFSHKYPYGTINDSLYNHDLDRISYQGRWYPAPWHAKGVQAKANKMDAFYKEFAKELARRGLPRPLFVDPDDESNYFNYSITGDNQLDFNLLMADPRATREKIDGLVTLRHYVDNFKTLNGEPFHLTKWPPQYDSSTDQFAHLFSSLEFRIRDYAQWYSNFVFVKKYLGYDVACHNWYQAAANYSNPTYNVRFKETWCDYNGSAFRMDKQVWSTYGANFDNKEFDWSPGAKTFNACKDKFDTDDSKAIAEQVVDLYLKEIDANLRLMAGASRKPKVLWFAYANYDISSDFVPPNGTHFETTIPVMQRVIDVCTNNKVDTLGLFEPRLTRDVADKYLSVITASSSQTQL